MKPACIAAVSAAAGRELRKSEIDEIEATIRKQREQMARQDRTAYLAMSPEAQIAEAARRAGQELLAEAAQKRREVIGKINAHARIVAAGGETYDGMRRFIESDSDNKSRVQSLESIVEAETKFAVGSLIDAWTAVKGNFFGVFTNARETMDLLKELHGEDSGNARAKKGAEAWKTVTEAMRQKANAVGIRIPKLEDWNIPRSWDQAKVFALGRDKFVDLLFDRANRAKYVHDNGALYTDAELRDFLGHAWESIATDGANKQRPVAVQSGSGNSIKFTLSGIRGPRGQRTANAAKGSLSRQIHLKDAAAYAEIHRAVGERDMFDVMLGHVQMTAAETVAVQQFGANPPRMLELFLANARAREKAAGRSDDYVNGQEYRIRNSFDYITGATTGPINERVARMGSNFRQWQVASKLGSAAITSIGDEATMIVTARMNNLSPFKVWGQSLRYLVGAKDLGMARRAGLGVDSVIGAMNRFGYENTVRSLPSKLANAVMTLSLLNRLTDARKAGFGAMMYSAIGKKNREVARLADLDPVDNQILLSKGITERDWAVWKLAQREDWGAGTKDVLTPASIMRISDADMDTTLRAEAAQNQAELQTMLDSLAAKDAQEADWLQNRQQKLDEARDKMLGELDQYAERRDLNLVELQQRATDLRELLDAKVDEAIGLSEASRIAASESTQGRIAGIVERAGGQAARMGAGVGRAVGRLQERAGTRVKTIEARIAKAKASADAGLNAKAEELGRDMSRRIADLDGFTARLRERQKERDQRYKELRTKADDGDTTAQQQIDRLNEQDAKEVDWLDQRQARVDEARDKAFTALDEYAARHADQAAALREQLNDTRDLMDAKLEQAQIELEAATQRIAGTVRDQAAGSAESAANRAVGMGAAAGRNLARIQERAKARVAEIEGRIRRAESAASKEVNAKAEAVGRAVSKRIAELDEYTQRLQARQASRQQAAGRMRVAMRQDFETQRYLARNEAMQKLVGATLEETDTAVLTPRASERARVRGALGNLQPGTYGGEIAQTVMIFKSYPMAFLMRNGRRMMGQEGTTSKLRYAGAMIVTTTLAGMLALQVNQILQGKDPKNMFKGKNVAKNWLAALLKGGALGIYGDFLLSPTSRYGQSPLIALLGPGFGTVSDISDLTIGNIQRGASGKDVRVGAGAVSLLKGNTPGASLWYAKAALDHWIFQQMQEALSPGHLRKTKARAQREFGDSYWWEPGTATPQRPPNLETAVGQ